MVVEGGHVAVAAALAMEAASRKEVCHLLIRDLASASLVATRRATSQAALQMKALLSSQLAASSSSSSPISLASTLSPTRAIATVIANKHKA